MIEFELHQSNTDDEYIALNQLLKATQLCESGAMANIVISEGLVQVNGKADTRKRAKLRKGDLVEFEGETIKLV